MITNIYEVTNTSSVAIRAINASGA